jgi:hypothetical protein
MKIKLILAAALCAGFALAASAAGDHGHHHPAPPKGGRLIAKTTPSAEFVIEKDRSMTINFYDAAMKPVAVAGQSVTVIADAKGGKSEIGFEKKGDALVSKAKLPDGEGYGLIIQFRQTAEAKPQNLRLKLDLSICGECKQAEYACVCDH